MQNRGETNAWGMDVSHYQGDIDWAQVAAAGISFVFVKATQGVRSYDDHLLKNVVGASDAGILVGVYTFSEANTPSEAQAEAEFLLYTLNGLGITDRIHMELMLDSESTAYGDFSPAAGDAMYRAWEQVITAAGKRSGIYTGNSFGQTHFTSAINDAPLWVARYGTTPPWTIGWTEWTFWQYSEGGTVPGVGGLVDMNVYKGTYEELYATYKPAQGGEAPMTKEDADKLITLLKAVYSLVPDKEIGRLADVLRTASGQPTENS